MKNKGFTLLELMGVIALLGIIALIAVPAIDRTINSSKEKLSKTQENQIIKGAKDYFAEHSNELPCNEEEHAVDNSCLETVVKSINVLQTEGYLPYDIVDPKTDNDYSVGNVKVTKQGNKYTYEFVQVKEETAPSDEEDESEQGE